MNNIETRLLPTLSLTSAYALVSMPKTAWYWLDDLVKTCFPTGGYKAMIRDAGDVGGKPDDLAALSAALRRKAQEHGETQMADLYNLANDNAPANGYDGTVSSSPSLPTQPDISANMPSMYQLFRFIPHATYLTTVWERRNYHLKG